MTRKELINSKDYITASIECWLYDYRQAKPKKIKDKIEKKIVKWILEYREEYLELNKQ